MKSLWIGVVALLSGCGSSVDATAFGGDDAAADGSVDGGGLDTASPDSSSSDAPLDSSAVDTGVDTGPPVTLDTVCTKLADGVCSKAADTCCTKSGLGYDDPTCHKNTMASCAESVAAVKAGTKKFDPSALGACIDAWNKLETVCNVNLIEFVRTYPACQQLFGGKTAPGGACKVDGDCAATPGAFADCPDPAFPATSTTCRQYTVVGKDAPCATTGDVQALCDLGLYCALTGGSGKGTCKPAKKPGDSCDPAAWWECGYGYVCQGASPFGGTNKCAEGKPAGAFCAREAECASWSCTSNKCGPTSFPIATRGLCGGG